MRRLRPLFVLVSLLLLVSLASCKRKKVSLAPEETPMLQPTPTQPTPSLPEPPVIAPQAPVESFAGVYVSSFGTTVTFSQVGASVESSLTAAHGRILCTAHGLRLDCVWRNGRSSGREVLVKQPDGTLKGTFGNGTSSTGGFISFRKVRS